MIPNEFVLSANKSGPFLIFTSSCGVADCGGWGKVNVTHNRDSIIWDFDYDGKVFYFEFHPDKYKQEIELLKSEIIKYGDAIVLEPEFIVDPEE